ncbi:hypothetical protein AVEN_167876-1 [Araneus ventricosus]|uniref:Uncharacterized protein n=1 Tax=Araneus ventricosus TaxID=182803 RepID=A0A4Y2SY44_ARAVE|nr:hypothetical protein AVEN_167876-1 [Araneus ventricosus]
MIFSLFALYLSPYTSLCPEKKEEKEEYFNNDANSYGYGRRKKVRENNFSMGKLRNGRPPLATLIFGSYYFCFVQFSLFPMPKRKRGITGDAASRREAIIKRERRVAETEEERRRRLPLWHNVAIVDNRCRGRNRRTK